MSLPPVSKEYITIIILNIVCVCVCVCVCIDIILYHVMLTFTKVRRVSVRPHYLVNILEAHGKSSWRMPMHVISSTKTSTLPCKHTRAQPFLSRISAWERAARFERSWIAFFCMASAASRRSRNNLSSWLWDNIYSIYIENIPE